VGGVPLSYAFPLSKLPTQKKPLSLFPQPLGCFFHPNPTNTPFFRAPAKLQEGYQAKPPPLVRSHCPPATLSGSEGFFLGSILQGGSVPVVNNQNKVLEQTASKIPRPKNKTQNSLALSTKKPLTRRSFFLFLFLFVKIGQFPPLVEQRTPLFFAGWVGTPQLGFFIAGGLSFFWSVGGNKRAPLLFGPPVGIALANKTTLSFKGITIHPLGGFFAVPSFCLTPFHMDPWPG